MNEQEHAHAKPKTTLAELSARVDAWEGRLDVNTVLICRTLDQLTQRVAGIQAAVEAKTPTAQIATPCGRCRARLAAVVTCFRLWRIRQIQKRIERLIARVHRIQGRE